MSRQGTKDAEPLAEKLAYHSEGLIDPTEIAGNDLNTYSDVPEIREVMNKYLTSNKASISRDLNKKQQYAFVDEVLTQQGLPEWLSAVAMIESGYRPEARSPRGAAGMWQFTKGTAKAYGLRTSGVDQRKDPLLSSKAAAKHLSDLYDRFEDWTLALAAYNAGSAAVDKAIKQGGSRNFWNLSRRGFLARETRQFVPKVLAAAILSSDPEGFGLQQ